MVVLDIMLTCNGRVVSPWPENRCRRGGHGRHSQVSIVFTTSLCAGHRADLIWLVVLLFGRDVPMMSISGEVLVWGTENGYRRGVHGRH